MRAKAFKRQMAREMRSVACGRCGIVKFDVRVREPQIIYLRCVHRGGIMPAAAVPRPWKKAR